MTVELERENMFKKKKKNKSDMEVGFVADDKVAMVFLFLKNEDNVQTVVKEKSGGEILI